MQRIRQVLSDCWFALRIYAIGNGLLVAVHTLLWLINALLPALELLLLKAAIDLLVLREIEQALLPLGIYAISLLLQPILQTVDNFLLGILQDKAGQNATRETVGILQQAVTIDLYDLPAYHDALSILQMLGSNISQAATSLYFIVQSVLQCITISLVLWQVSPWIPLLLLLTVLPHIFIKDKTTQLTYSGLIQRTPEERKLSYLRGLMLDDQQAPEIRFFGLLPYLRQQYDAIFHRVLAQQLPIYQGQALLTCSVSVVSWLGMAGALLLAGWQLVAGTGTVGGIAMVFSAITQLAWQVSVLGNNLGSAAAASLYAGQFRQLLTLIQPFTADAGGQPLLTPIERLDLVDVSFHYPGSEWEVLSKVNLSLRRGETVALVGANGAGKTTLAKLILGLYDPVVGQVLVNGKPLTMYDRASVRARMSAVFQVFGKYFLTVRENVGFGDLPQLEEDEQIKRALAKADALPFIAKLPDGLDAQLGKRFGGHELSGGEWQKLALARSLLKAEADVLVLDEPSAALDADTEYHLYLRFKEMIANRIGVLISHRFSTVRMADRIVVLDGGTIVEEGTHEELLALDGLYARMYHQQADRYTEAEAEGAC